MFVRTHGMGLLAELFDFTEGEEGEAHAWLDEVRLSRMLEVPGMKGGASYEVIGGAPRFLNLIEANNIHVFYGEEFTTLMNSEEMRFPKTPGTHIRLVCAQVYPGLPAKQPNFPSVEVAGLAPIIQFGRINVPEENLGDFNGWYSCDRGPLCEEVPGVRRMRRYNTVEGPRLMIVLYEMEDESVRETSEWKHMNASEWTARVRSYYRQEPGSPGVYKRRGYAR